VVDGLTLGEEIRLTLLLYGIIAVVVCVLVMLFVIAPMRGWWPWSTRAAKRADERTGAEQERDRTDS